MAIFLLHVIFAYESSFLVVVSVGAGSGIFLSVEEVPVHFAESLLPHRQVLIREFSLAELLHAPVLRVDSLPPLLQNAAATVTQFRFFDFGGFLLCHTAENNFVYCCIDYNHIIRIISIKISIIVRIVYFQVRVRIVFDFVFVFAEYVKNIVLRNTNI